MGPLARVVHDISGGQYAVLGSDLPFQLGAGGCARQVHLPPREGLCLVAWPGRQVLDVPCGACGGRRIHRGLRHYQFNLPAGAGYLYPWTLGQSPGSNDTLILAFF